MNISFYNTNTKEEIFNIESPSLKDAFENVHKYFDDMAEYEGNSDLMDFVVVDKKDNAWLIKNHGTEGTYLLYIKTK